MLFVYQLAPLRQRSGLIGHCGHAVRNVSPEYHRTLGGASTRQRQTGTSQSLIDYRLVYYLHVKPDALVTSYTHVFGPYSLFQRNDHAILLPASTANCMLLCASDCRRVIFAIFCPGTYGLAFQKTPEKNFPRLFTRYVNLH